MRADIDLLNSIAKSPEALSLDITIRHVIPTDYDHSTLGVAWLAGGRSHYPELKLLCCAEWPSYIVSRTLEHLKNKSMDLITINSCENVTIAFYWKFSLDAISYPNTSHPSYSKSLIRVDNATSESHTRKISMSSIAGECLSRLFFSLLMSQLLCLDRTYLLGRENQVSDAISFLKENKLAFVNYLLQAYPLLASFSHCHPLLEISLRIFNFLEVASEDLTEALRLNGQFIPTKNMTRTGDTTCS